MTNAAKEKARARWRKYSRTSKYRQWLLKYRTKHAAELRQYQKGWRLKNLEHCRELDRKQAKKHAVRRQKYNTEHAEEHKEYRVKWRNKNAAKELSTNRAWKAGNPDKCLEYGRANRKKNINRYRVQGVIKQARRRARKRSSGGYFTLEQWENLLERYGHKCLCCHRTDVPICADHVIPLARDGTSWIWNMQPLCVSCNSKKGTRSNDYRFDHRFEASNIKTKDLEVAV